MHQEKCDMSLVLFTNNLSSLVLLPGCARRGVVPTAACDTNISPVVGWGPEERKKKDGGQKLYLRKQWTLMLEWPSDFLQLLSLFRHAVQPAHHFAPAFHLLFVKNATCTLASA